MGGMDNNIDLKAIIFDKDGTLFNYASVWHQVIEDSIDEAFKNINEKRREKRKRNLVKLLGIDADGNTIASGVIFSHNKYNITKKGIRYCITNLMLPSTLVKYTKEIMKYNNIFIEEKIKSMDFSKQRALFQKLKKLGYKIAVVTVDNRISANIFLKYMGIQEFVDYTVTKDDDIAQKPKPDSFIHFCNMFDLDPSQVAMVGDTITDMKYAKNSNAGYKVGVLWGANDLAGLEKYADVIYPDIFYLLDDPIINKK